MKSPSPNSVPTDVYLSFVSSLFGNRKTLFTGMIVQILTYRCRVCQIRRASFTSSCSAVFICRSAPTAFIGSAVRRGRQGGHGRRDDIARWERQYLYGGVSTTTLLGIGSGYAILSFRIAFAEFICIAVTMASMVSSRRPQLRLAEGRQSADDRLLPADHHRLPDVARLLHGDDVGHADARSG